MESFSTYLFWGELCPVLGRIKNQSSVFGSCFRMLAVIVSDFFFFFYIAFRFNIYIEREREEREIRVCLHLETRSNFLKRSKKIEAVII